MKTEGNVAQVALYILQFKKSIWIQFSYNTKDNTSERGRTAGTKSQKALVVHQVGKLCFLFMLHAKYNPQHGRPGIKGARPEAIFQFVCSNTQTRN